MSDTSGDEFVVSLRADTSQLLGDLKTADVELARIQTRVNALEKATVTAFNKSGLSGLGGVSTATSAADVQKATSALPPATLQSYAPALAQAQQQLAQAQQAQAQRLQQLSQQAASGSPTLPPTERQAAQARLGALQQQQAAQQLQRPENKPLEITASSSFLSKWRQASMGTHISRAVSDATVGNSVGAGRNVLNGLLGLAGDNPLLAGAVGVIGAGVAMATAMSAQQASFQRQAIQLASSLGGPSLSAGYAAGEDATSQGQAFNYGRDQSTAAASQLALAGISKDNLSDSLAATFMLARQSGVDPGQIAPITSTLGVQGAMDHGQINRVYQDVANLSDAAGKGGPSLLRLIDSLKTLQQATGGASVNIAGLAAVQKLIGPAGNAGAMLAPLVGATGAQALQAAGVLGVTPDKFDTMRQHPDQLYDALGTFVKRVDPRGGAQGANIAEAALQSTGLVNLSSLGPQQQRQFIENLRTGNTGGAERLAGQMGATAAARRVSEQTVLGRVATTTTGQTPGQDRLGIAISNFMLGHRTSYTAGSAAQPGDQRPVSRSDQTMLAAAARRYGIPAAVLARQYASTAATRDLFTATGATSAQDRISVLARADQQGQQKYGSLSGAINAVATGSATMGPARQLITAARQHAAVVAAASPLISNQAAVNAWSTGVPPAQKLEITVKLVDQNSGRSMGQASVMHTLTQPSPSRMQSNRLSPGRTVVGSRTHGPGR